MISNTYQQEINNLIGDLKTWDNLDWNEHPYEHKEKINDAILKLENILNRKCSNCKHWHSKKIDHPNYRECNNEETFNLRYEETYFDFCCNKWESK